MDGCGTGTQAGDGDDAPSRAVARETPRRAKEAAAGLPKQTSRSGSRSRRHSSSRSINSKHGAGNSSRGESRAIVIDNGSGWCRAGLADEEVPSMVFPMRVETDQGSGNHRMIGIHAGEQAVRPVVCGEVRDWEALTAVWEHVMQTLGGDEEDTAHPRTVLMTEPPDVPRAQRERMLEAVFEQLAIQRFCVRNTAVSSLYASDCVTGTSVDLGYDRCVVAAVYDGYVLPHSLQRVPVAGAAQDRYLSALLAETGQRISVREACGLRESVCYVAADFEAEMRAAHSQAAQHVAIAGRRRSVRLGSERFRCTESLFQPSFLGREHGGVHEAVYNALMKGDVDIRRDLFANIHMSGGLSMYPGLRDRMQRDITALLGHRDIPAAVSVPRHRRHAAWHGAARYAAAATPTVWVTRAQFQEAGSALVHARCY